MTAASDTIRIMERSDLPAGLRLSHQAQWNQTPEDWRRLLDWEPAGCFALDLAGQVVGTVTTTCYGGDLAWVGMLLVDAANRQRGFGRRLLLHALAHLEQRGIGAVMLDATPLGRPLYGHLGFQEQYGLDRWQGIARIPPAASPNARPLDFGTVSPAVLDLDRRAFGLDRSRLLVGLLTGTQAKGLWAGTTDQPAGYVILRPGAERWHVGPLVANDAASAARLLQSALGTLNGHAVELDVPSFPFAHEIVRGAGLSPVRPFIRMLRGKPPPAGDLSRIYATAAPEIG
jgi:GNAT superfamily N-acetyltransferase